MGNELKIDLEPYHKVSYNGKFASSVKAAGKTGWTEEKTPTGINWPTASGLKMHLPFVNHNHDTTRDTNSTYDYKQNKWWKNSRSSSITLKSVRTSGIGCPLSYLPTGANMALAGDQVAWPYQKSWNMLHHAMAEWNRAGGYMHGANTMGAVVRDKFYTLSFWVYASSSIIRRAEETSRFSFGMIGGNGWRTSSGGPGSGSPAELAKYAVGQHKFSLDHWPTHKMPSYAAGGVVLRMSASPAATPGSWTSYLQKSIVFTASQFPSDRWNHVTINVAHGHFMIGINGKQTSSWRTGHSKKDDKAYGVFEIKSGHKVGSASVPDTAFTQYSNSPFTAWYKSGGRAFRISDFRVYGRYLHPIGKEVAHIRNHRNQYGDLNPNRVYPTPEGDMDGNFADLESAPDETPSSGPDFGAFTSDLFGRIEHDGVTASDIHQVTSDFDNRHGTSFLDIMGQLPTSHLEEMMDTPAFDLGETEAAREAEPGEAEHLGEGQNI